MAESEAAHDERDRIANRELSLDERAQALREAVPDVLRRQQEAIDRSRDVLQRADERLVRAEASLQRSRAAMRRDDAEIQREVTASDVGKLEGHDEPTKISKTSES
jgi:tRNA threonylcarbamoyladenosine modification (KEOPS) complex  Pcc1 subunit